VDILKSLETVQGKYSEIAINSPDGLSVVRFCVDPIAEKIYSTQAAEVDFIRNAQKNNVSLLEAINQLIAQNIAQGKKR
jgi:conjugal transfer ATP-binding protein TraC